MWGRFGGKPAGFNAQLAQSYAFFAGAHLLAGGSVPPPNGH